MSADEEIARTLRDLSHDARVAGKSMPRFGRLADVLRLVANEIEALGPAGPDSVYEVCDYPWRGNSGEQYRCVRIVGHPKDDRPIGGGGHTATREWAGR